MSAGHTQEQEGGTPLEHFQEEEGVKSPPELEEVGFQDAEKMEEMEVGPSFFATHSEVRQNTIDYLEVEHHHLTRNPIFTLVFGMPRCCHKKHRI